MRILFVSCALLLMFPPARVHAQVPTPTKASVEGDVVDSVTGAPIAGARIRLGAAEAQRLYGRSDDRGHFAFENLMPALYTLNVERPGYLPLGFMSPGETRSDFAAVDLRASRPRGSSSCCTYPPPEAAGPPPIVTRSTRADGTLYAKVTVKLIQYGVISGRVTDPEGFPLEGCQVELQMVRPVSKNGQPNPFALAGGKIERVPISVPQLTTNDKGEFRAGSLRPGQYYIEAQTNMAPGSESTYRITFYPDAVTLESAQIIELAGGREVRADIRIWGKRGVRVAGRISLPRDAKTSSGASLRTKVATAGRFAAGVDTYELQGVLPGKHILMAFDSDQPGDAPTRNENPSFGLMRSAEVGDRDMDGVDLALRPLGDLNGVVTFAEGCTPRPVNVILIPLDFSFAERQPQATTGFDGKFVIRHVPPGRFVVGGGGRGQSIRLGDRDVLKEGLEAPITTDQPLRIELGCNSGRRP